MRVAVFHNRYRDRGGEDRVVDVEVELLRKAGHEVHLLALDNREELASPAGALRTALTARWSARSHRRVAGLLAAHRFDVGHVHNLFPVLTPAVYTALQDAGVPVVQTLHNYRLLCGNGLFLRDGRPCEDCVTHGVLRAVRFGCWRGSRLQSAVWADFAAHHRRRGTWARDVDLFCVPSRFAREKLRAAGLPDERVMVKPNPVLDPGEPRFGGRGAVFVGRLSKEKGAELLLRAWRGMGEEPLRILGTGPDEARLRSRARDLPQVELPGRLPPDAVNDALRDAAYLVIPSLWYENFPMVLGEAMALGVPAVVPHPTALSDLVEDGRTGLWFERGSEESLLAACRRLSEEPELASALGREARAHFEDEWSPDRALEHLARAYERAARLRLRRGLVPAR